MKSLSILLVEDDLALAKSTAKLIERLSTHQVQVTDQPKTIFELCQTGKIDIVIMDINLPGATWKTAEVSGADLARILKKQTTTAHIPIIILTAYGLGNEKESLMADSQADEFVIKPIRDYRGFIELLEQTAQY